MFRFVELKYLYDITWIGWNFYDARLFFFLQIMELLRPIFLLCFLLLREGDYIWNLKMENTVNIKVALYLSNDKAWYNICTAESPDDNIFLVITVISIGISPRWPKKMFKMVRLICIHERKMLRQQSPLFAINHTQWRSPDKWSSWEHTNKCTGKKDFQWLSGYSF